MKQLILLVLITPSLYAMELAVRDKAREEAMAESPACLQSSVIIRETEHESFDSLFEQPRPLHPKICICIDCLEQSYRDLEFVNDKLAILKEKKIEDGPAGIAAARVVAKLVNITKGCQQLTFRASSPAHTVSETVIHKEEEFESLTEPGTDTFRWRLKDAGLI